MKKWTSQILKLLPAWWLAIGSTIHAAGPPPVITVQPQSQTIIRESSVTFSVQAVSATKMSYQWRFNGKNVKNATKSSYTIARASADGVVCVQVINASGAVLSSNAYLKVLPPIESASDAYKVAEDNFLSVPAPGILKNDFNRLAAPLSAVLLTNVARGTLNLAADGSFAYRPRTNFHGVDSFVYAAKDTANRKLGDWTVVTITVDAVPDPPIAVDDSATTAEDTSVLIPVLRNDSSPDGVPLQLKGASTSAGTTEVRGTEVLFTPRENFFGQATFSYSISDGTNSAVAQVLVSVTPVNDAPLSRSDEYAVPANATAVVPAPGLLANDTDVENDSLKAVLVKDVSHGVLQLNPDGSFTYTPSKNYFGTDSFTYQASDRVTNSQTSTVTLRVQDLPAGENLWARMTAEGLKLEILDPQAATYDVYATSTFQRWNLLGSFPALGGKVLYTDTNAVNYNMRFYRALPR